MRRLRARERGKIADSFRLLGRRDEVTPGYEMVLAVCQKSVVSWRGTDVFGAGDLECNDANKEKLLVESRVQATPDGPWESLWQVIENKVQEQSEVSEKN